MVSVEFILKGAQMRRNVYAGIRSVTGPLSVGGRSGRGQSSVVSEKVGIHRGVSGAEVPAIVVEADIGASGLMAEAQAGGAWRGTVWLSDLDEGLAGDVSVRDGHSDYVSEAPYARFSRMLSALLSITSAAGSI